MYPKLNGYQLKIFIIEISKQFKFRQRSTRILLLRNIDVVILMFPERFNHRLETVDNALRMYLSGWVD